MEKKPYAKLRGKMAERGYSQKKLAEELGITEQTLSGKLNGKTEFKRDEILRIAEILMLENPAEIFFVRDLHDVQACNTN